MRSVTSVWSKAHIVAPSIDFARAYLATAVSSVIEILATRRLPNPLPGPRRLSSTNTRNSCHSVS